MRKRIETWTYAGTFVHRECGNVGFIGACLRLWRFWRRNGTGHGDHDEFRIRVLTSDHDRMRAQLSRLKASEESVSPETRKKALERLLDDDIGRRGR